MDSALFIIKRSVVWFSIPEKSKGVTWSAWSFNYITQVVLEVTETGEESIKISHEWDEVSQTKEVKVESHLGNKIE